MLKIRLQRVGRKNNPSFRVVLTESKNSTKSGKFKEILGSHDARLKQTQLKEDRIKYWIGQGAQVSDTLHNLLIEKKVIEGKKVNVLPKKTPQKKDEPTTSPVSPPAGAGPSQPTTDPVSPPAGAGNSQPATSDQQPANPTVEDTPEEKPKEEK